MRLLLGGRVVLRLSCGLVMLGAAGLLLFLGLADSSYGQECPLSPKAWDAPSFDVGLYGASGVWKVFIYRDDEWIQATLRFEVTFDGGLRVTFVEPEEGLYQTSRGVTRIRMLGGNANRREVIFAMELSSFGGMERYVLRGRFIDVDTLVGTHKQYLNQDTGAIQRRIEMEPERPWCARRTESSRVKASDFPMETMALSELTGTPTVLKHDDSVPAGIEAMSSDGFAMRFDTPDGRWCLRGLLIHGDGTGQFWPPDNSFLVWLCDRSFKTIAQFSFPCSLLDEERPKWITLPIEDPVLLPPHFILCVYVQQMPKRAIRVSHDRAGDGQALVGLPGVRSKSFGKGDWLIRAVIDQPKSESRPRR